MTGESLYPRDLIERLRGALDEREPFARRRAERPSRVGEPGEALRTIQAHRKITDEFEMLANDRRRLTDAAMHLQFSVMRRVVIMHLASIYFPESDG